MSPILLAEAIAGKIETPADRRWQASWRANWAWFGEPTPEPLGRPAPATVEGAIPEPVGPEVWKKALRASNRRPSPQLGHLNLTPGEELVALTIGDMAALGLVWATSRSIASASGFCKRVVDSARRKLEQGGYLIRYTHGAGIAVPGKRRAGGAVFQFALPGGIEALKSFSRHVREVKAAVKAGLARVEQPSVATVLEQHPNLGDIVAKHLGVEPVPGGVERVVLTLGSRTRKRVNSWPAYVRNALSKDASLRAVYFDKTPPRPSVAGTVAGLARALAPPS